MGIAEKILMELAGSGLIGAILAFFMWRNMKLTDRTFDLIENNTKHMAGTETILKELKISIDQCPEKK